MIDATEDKTKQSVIFVILVTLMGMLSLLPSDMYLPALPALQQTFSTNITSIQFTLSIFFLGAAISQIVIGPLVDRYGLRPLGISAILLFIIASILCMCSTSIQELIIARFVQASGAGFAAVIARAAISKKYDTQKAAHVFLIMGPILSASPAIAPMIGGVLTKYFGWRSIFAFITLLGIMILIFAFKYLFVQEDKSHAKESIHPIKIFNSYITIMKNKYFLTYLLTRCAVDACYFAYITASPFIFYKIGYSITEIGNFYIMLILTFVATSYLTKRLMDKYNKNHLMILGLFISILGGVMLFVIGFTNYQFAAEIIIPAAIMTAGYGFTGSLAWPEAMAQVKSNQAGSASSLIGFFPMLASAVAAGLVNVITHGSVTLLGLFMIILLSAATLGLFIVTKQKKELTIVSEEL